jgi:hypothetical protein
MHNEQGLLLDGDSLKQQVFIIMNYFVLYSQATTAEHSQAIKEHN